MPNNDRTNETPDDWVTETPNDPVEYQLAMWVSGEAVQDVEITREEFIELKDHLAKLRELATVKPRNPAIPLSLERGVAP